MFLQSLVNFNNSISLWNFAPNLREDQKKRYLPHSGSISVQNFGFPVAKWVLPKNRKGLTYFALFNVRHEGVQLPPKIDAYGLACLFLKQFFCTEL